MIVIGACSSSSSGGDEPKLTGPKITVGIKVDQPGIGVRAQDGTVSGFDVDVAKYVARHLGTDPSNVSFVEAVSADRETLLEQRKVDFVVASYSITDGRKARVDFAGPYLATGQSLLVRKSNADISGPDSLNNSDWRLCSVKGSTSAQLVKDQYAKSVTLQEFPSYRACVDAMREQAVDAVTTDEVILAGYVAEQPDLLKLVGSPFSFERYGVGLVKGDPRHAKVTEALRAMVGDGSWQKYAEANLGRAGKPMPPAPTVLDTP
ncbi:glutamate ABC transporter substrate-binding protein [Herbihabitans rhizosphaerae]|uniref:glutamate ABC transporter substrate-binding protein n=1 Tax=Herbihabitans rhizosphaerae TaxID=1872711 RepID=UPI001F5F0382|nr:glutamate ABC transporter substrate-binding protein [Herbihabitans rhizosphaerae]